MSNPAALKRASVVLVALTAIALAIVAPCGGSNDSGGTKIALLLPENETPRYESNDRPDFEKAVEELCPDCEVLYSNANGDAEKQQSQAEAALTQGAEVMVVDPMDSKSAAAIAEKAKAQNVPVRQLRPPDRKRRNRRLRLLRQRKSRRTPGRNAGEKTERRRQRQRPDHHDQRRPRRPQRRAVQRRRAQRVRRRRDRGRERVRHPGWTAENAQREAQQAITALGNDGFAGIYAANDDTGGGAIAALKGAGLNPEEKPVTGQDATVAGLQRILAGQQYMTVYKEITPEAEISAEIAIALAEGEEVPQDKVTEEIDNGKPAKSPRCC